MSTRSLIGIKENNKYSVIYCHSDGYPEHNGKILLEHYNSMDMAKELIALGDLSLLGERIAPNPGEKHTFDEPLDNVTIAYHRDRGEKLNPAANADSLKELLKIVKDSWAEYIYIFDEESNEWICSPCCYNSKKLDFQQVQNYFTGKEAK